MQCQANYAVLSEKKSLWERCLHGCMLCLAKSTLAILDKGCKQQNVHLSLWNEGILKPLTCMLLTGSKSSKFFSKSGNSRMLSMRRSTAKLQSRRRGKQLGIVHIILHATCMLCAVWKQDIRMHKKCWRKFGPAFVCSPSNDTIVLSKKQKQSQSNQNSWEEKYVKQQAWIIFAHVLGGGTSGCGTPLGTFLGGGGTTGRAIGMPSKLVCACKSGARIGDCHVTTKKHSILGEQARSREPYQ